MDSNSYWRRVLEQARDNAQKPCSVPHCMKMRQTKSIVPFCSIHATRLRITGSPVGITLRNSNFEKLSKRIRILFESNRSHVGLVTAERKLRHAMQDAKPYSYERMKRTLNTEGLILARLRDHKVPAVDVLSRAAAVYCINRADPQMFEIRKSQVGDKFTFEPDQFWLTQLGRAVSKLMPNEKSAGGYPKHTSRRAIEGFGRWLVTEFTVFFEQTAIAMDRLAEHAERERQEALKPLDLPDFESDEWDSLTDDERTEAMLEAVQSAVRKKRRQAIDASNPKPGSRERPLPFPMAPSAAPAEATSDDPAS